MICSNEAERRVLFLMRQMVPFDKVEIKKDGDGVVKVSTTHTTQETFPGETPKK